MDNYIEYRDLETVLKYARIYGLANQREDILAQCSMLRRKAGRGVPDGKAMLAAEDGRILGKMFLYALASVGSAGGGAGGTVCRIVCKYYGLMAQYDRASAMAVADMMKDMRKGEECPFCELYDFLEKKEKEGGCGEGTR